MLEILREAFNETLKDNPDLIIQNHVLSEGLYILVDKQGEYKEFLVTKKNPNTEDPLYNKFKEYDIYSSYINSNKSFYDKKISSVVYTAVSIKHENLKLEKSESKHWTVDEALDNILKNFELYKEPRLKYKKDKSKAVRMPLYEDAEKKYGKADESKLEFFKEWLVNNLKEIAKKYNDSKLNYIKIFLEEDIKVYKSEYLKYLSVNILNEAKILENGEIKGVHSLNSNLNSKKPFLLSKTKKCDYAVLVTPEIAMEYFWISRLLDGYAKNLQLVVYIGDNSIEGYDARKLDLIKIKSKKPKYVLFLECDKGSAIIKDFDTLNYFENDYISLNFENVICRNKFEIGENSYLKTLKSQGLGQERLDRFGLVRLIDAMFFSKYLYSNLLSEDITVKPKDSNPKKKDSKSNNTVSKELNETTLKNMIGKYRLATKDYLYKENYSRFESMFKSISLDSLKMYLDAYGASNYVIERFMAREAILDYLEGDRNMKNKLAEMYDNLAEKQSDYQNHNTIDSIEEYSFIIGQLVSYLGNLSNSKDKNNNLSAINTFINARNDKALKNELRKLFKIYNYKLETRKSVRFKHLYSLVLGCEPTEKYNEDFMIGGYLYKNVLFEPGKNGSDKDVENNENENEGQSSTQID